MSGNPPAGYYADPSIPGYIRYWDGETWVAGTSRPAPEEAAGAASPAPVRDQVPDAPAGGEAWRPQPSLEVSQASVVQQAAQPAEPVAQPAAQSLGQQAVPEQFQQQYAPQQYAPAPAEPYQQAAEQVPQQFVQQQYAPQPQIPQQYQPGAPQAYPAVPSEAPAPQRPDTVVGMVVPSAFRNAPGTGTFARIGAANPFAGLPGALAAAVPEPQEEGVETTVLELATPGSRFLARLIDLGIAAVFSAPITVSLLLVAHRHDHQYVLNLDAQATTTYTTLGMDAVGIALWGGAAVALVLVAIMYEGYRLGRGGQTAGKRLAGIRVVRLDDAHPVRGSGLGLRRALLFWVLAVLPLVDLLALGGVLWGRPYRQGLHERVTSTATVKA
ncbi:RDD family protein [Actinospica durhamensis]|uniref:RDD family protein n=1 Tax=Actinospica durhamensis TaxID=1508375 RepID=A0A941EUK9_9ACTN|nr:RDD family protein [Actinospica durhamensis]MBR7836677.1 RDD family protein [Actinospica durhamensis]